MIKLIVSDLDGTLLQENHLMNQETIDEIKTDGEGRRLYGGNRP